jgi:hypothetical protein
MEDAFTKRNHSSPSLRGGSPNPTRTVAILRSISFSALNEGEDMNKSRLALLALWLVFLMANLVQAKVTYKISPDLDPLWPGEVEVLKQVAAGNPADLRKRFGEDEKKREIRGKFLEVLLTEGFQGLKVHRHGVYLRNAIIKIEDRIDLRSAVVPYEVRLVSCIFQGDVNLQDSLFKYSLQITKSRFLGQAYFLGFEVTKNAYFNETTFDKELNCNWAKIGNEFSLIKARLLSNDRSYFNSMQVGQNLLGDHAEFQGPTEFRNMNVGGSFDITAAIFHGGAYFAGSTVRRSFWAKNTQFLSEKNYASFPGLKVGNVAIFQEALFKGPVDFDDAHIGLELQCQKAKFLDVSAGLEAIGLKVGTFANFEDVIFAGPVNFDGTDCAGQFNATRAQFNSDGEANFRNLKVGSLLQFTDALFNGPVSLAGARIGELKADVQQGAVLTGGVFRGPVDLKDAHLSDLSIIGTSSRKSVTSPGIAAISDLNLERAVVDRDIRFEDVKLNRLMANGLQAKGQTTLNGLSIETEADLRNSHFANLKILGVVWPPDRDKVQFSGMTYNFIAAAEGPVRPQDWRKLIAWVHHSSFDNRNYLQLRSFFEQNGHQGLADEVFIDMRRQETWPSSWVDWLNPAVWFKVVFWDFLAGYGRKPFRIFWAALAIVILGAFYYDPRYLTEINWPQKSRFYGLLGRFLISFEQFTPMVDLGMQKKWQPASISGRFSVFIYFQRLAGWVLVPIFLAAIYTKFR